MPPAARPPAPPPRASALHRLPISRRLLLIAVAFTLPLGAIVSLVDLNKDIAFARQELDGNAYQRRLVDAFEAVAEHQRVADAMVRAKAGVAPELQAARQRADAAFTALGAVDAELGASLQFTPDGLAQRKRSHVTVATVQQEWHAASAAAYATPADAAGAAHAHVLADLRTMTAHAGDTSNLVLDPDLDSYYAMHMTLLALPQTQERTASLLLWLQQAGIRGRLNVAERRHLAVTAAFLREADRDRIVADAETAFNEDVHFYGESPSLKRQLQPAVARYAAATTAFVDALNTAASKRGRVDIAAAIAAGLASRDASFALWRNAAAELDVLLQTRVRHYEVARLRALGVSGLAWAAAMVIVFVISRSVTRPLAMTSRALAVTARNVAATAMQVSASAQSLANGATEQAAALEQTSASMEEMASMTQRNADHAEQAAAVVTDVARRVEASNEALSDMVASMTAIRDSSSKVGRIIKTIDEIAFQSNILALNAAVEAARAGAAGLGFAVVADEVRTLAQRSARAAKDTEALLEESLARTGDGTARVEAVAGVITAITGDVARLEILVSEVRQASHQQSQGIAQVSQAIVQMEQVTQTTAATAEQTAAASAELNAHAETSMVVVGRLAAMVEQARPAVAATPAPRDSRARRAAAPQSSRVPSPKARSGRAPLRRAS